MTDTYDILAKKRNIKTAEQNWNFAIDFSDESTTHKLFEALLSEYDNIDASLEKIYEETHINSATGKELDQFGELVNVERKNNESDEKYRARIKATFRASTIGTTFDEFTEFCAIVLNTDISNLNFGTLYAQLPALVRVGADISVYENAGFSNEEIVNLIGKGVPAGHRVQVVEGGTFRVKRDGAEDDPEKGLTSDGIEEGGTLAEDLIG